MLNLVVVVVAVVVVVMVVVVHPLQMLHAQTESGKLVCLYRTACFLSLVTLATELCICLKALWSKIVVQSKNVALDDYFIAVVHESLTKEYMFAIILVVEKYIITITTTTFHNAL